MTFDLDRFKRAQEGPGGFATALADLEAGRKRSHWIWYIFPQLAGLGQSSTAIRYGLQGVEEASAYLGDPVLRDRLFQVMDAVLGHLSREEPVSLVQVMGSEIDAVKFVSSMTLFREVARRIGDRDIATRADTLLRAGDAQGYRACEFTLKELARQA